jgi:hypothetical protein
MDDQKQPDLFAEVEAVMRRGNLLCAAADTLMSDAFAIEEHGKTFRVTYKSEIICDHLPDKQSADRVKVKLNGLLAFLAGELRGEASNTVEEIVKAHSRPAPENVVEGGANIGLGA